MKMFEQFMQDPDAWDMYITGPAGSGKTTLCGNIVQMALDMGYQPIVCAHTHKACGILRTKLPAKALVVTTHSFLKKRPTVNQAATNAKKLKISTQVGMPEAPPLIIIDEYSQVGEADFASIRELQDEDYDGKPTVKVLWIGDPHQLPPVGDFPAVRPEGEYQVKLTKVHRQAADNPLMIPLGQLVSYIEGADPAPLEANSKFKRGVDLASTYLADPCEDKVMLAYTNRQVQVLNANIQGRAEPLQGDRVFCPSNQQYYTMEDTDLNRNVVDYVVKSFGEILQLGTKYKTLEHLLKMPDISFASVVNEDGDIEVLAYVFGHYNFKMMREHLSRAAADSNAAIVKANPGANPKAWSFANNTDPLARARAKAWRDFLTFDECVVCLDFPHAMTVHKSQGSTYEHVYVDTKDLGQVLNTNYVMYLKLMYVAISRASQQVFTN